MSSSWWPRSLPSARVVSHPVPQPAAYQSVPLARPAVAYTGSLGLAAALLRAYADELPKDQASALAWLRANSSNGALSMLRAVAIDIERKAADLDRRERSGRRA
jgi:hypothetical protein